jgi:hypothetical protein
VQAIFDADFGDGLTAFDGAAVAGAPAGAMLVAQSCSSIRISMGASADIDQLSRLWRPGHCGRSTPAD